MAKSLRRCEADEKPPCKGDVTARSLCSKHYTRFRKYGDSSIVLPKGTPPVDPKQRFETKYIVDEETGCWRWTGAANGNGWPTLTIDGKAYMAYRYAYEAYRGLIPGGYSVRRDCGHIYCVNPDHLSLVSKNSSERFWSNVDKTVDHWWWKPKAFSYRVDGRAKSPRRYAWEAENGATTDFLYSICDETTCVRPSHAGKSRDRFWAKVDKAKDGCWYWTGSKLSNGYPHLNYKGTSVYAHRLTFEWDGGVLEDGYILRHTCRHLDCVRPEHLEQITLGEMVQIREDNRVPTPCDVCGKVYRHLKGHVRVHDAS